MKPTISEIPIKSTLSRHAAIEYLASRLKWTKEQVEAKLPNPHCAIDEEVFYSISILITAEIEPSPFLNSSAKNPINLIVGKAVRRVLR